MIENIRFSSLYYEKAIALLKDICTVPSPSGMEDKRVEYILSYLRQEGIDSAYEDDAKNVIIPYNDRGNNMLDVFAAHTDVVFPDTVPLPMKIEGDKIHCPGIGDNTASFVALLMYVLYFFKEKPETRNGILFVCNSSEEGLGNLKGVKKLFSSYTDRIRSFTTFDACLGNGIVNTAVGSERFLIIVRTEGGHSYKDFGRRNAIAGLSEIITELYQQDVEKGTTYNVGTIKGGTSVNTIAQDAECTYEYRSTNPESLKKMRKNFEALIEKYQEDFCINFEEIGIRPCGIKCDTLWMEKIAEEAMDKYSLSAERKASSTDCNIPLSLGIPALCIGIVKFKGAHTREEVMDLSSYATGLDLGFDYINGIIRD